MLISSPEFIFLLPFWDFLLRAADTFWAIGGWWGGWTCLFKSPCVFGFLDLFWALEIFTWDTDVSTDVEGDKGGLIGCN